MYGIIHPQTCDGYGGCRTFVFTRRKQRLSALKDRCFALCNVFLPVYSQNYTAHRKQSFYLPWWPIKRPNQAGRLPTARFFESKTNWRDKWKTKPDSSQARISAMYWMKTSLRKSNETFLRLLDFWTKYSQIFALIWILATCKRVVFIEFFNFSLTYEYY